MRPPKARYRPAVLAVILSTACSTGNGSRPPVDSRSIVVQKNGDTTEVSVNDVPGEPPNAACLEYCRRLTACWYAVPNRDEAIPEAEVSRACLKEQNGCRTPTIETHCCATLKDCQDFVHCQARSHDVVSDCSRSPP